LNISSQTPLAISVTRAIHEGDLTTLERLLADNPELAKVVIVDARRGARTLLHIAADWPGHFPNGAQTTAILIKVGADPNATGDQFNPQKPSEVPLHWAASSDDVAVLDALLDGGADIEKPGACIAGGTPLDDAIAFGQWHATRRLVERGAQTALWHAAALGLMDRLQAHFSGAKLPGPFPWGKGAEGAPPEITVAFWCACHGGQLSAAKYLLERGGELNWVSEWDQLTPLDAAERAKAQDVVQWLRTQGGKSAKELNT
jgi:ankyrin repeat protein